MVVVATLVKAFKDSRDCGAVNAYRLGNFVMALALPLSINDVRHFCWRCVDHDRE